MPTDFPTTIAERYILQEVSVEDLIKAIDSSVDAPNGDLGDLFTRKMEDMLWSGYPDTDFDAFAAGRADKPIVVCPNGATGYADGWVVGNGNHRLAAAIAGMAETILVLFGEDRTDYMYSELTGD